jgi:hypothetical protein
MRTPAGTLITPRLRRVRRSAGPMRAVDALFDLHHATIAERDLDNTRSAAA